MEEKKEDRRILYTKMFLRESLLALLEDKPIEKITPTELCRHAGINRNTFYSHYRSPEELLHSMEQELLKKIEASISRQTSFLNTLYAMKNNAYYSRILLSPHCNRGLWQHILQESTERYRKDLSHSLPALPRQTCEMIAQYVVNGCIAVVQQWLYHGMITPPEDIDRFLVDISEHSISLFGQFTIDT